MREVVCTAGDNGCERKKSENVRCCACDSMRARGFF